MPKLSPDLRKRLAATPEGESLDVVVEVGQGAKSPSRKQGRAAGNAGGGKIAALKESFSASAAPIERAIESSGGRVLDRAWINQSLKARLPREAVEALGEREDVELVDTLRTLRPD